MWQRPYKTACGALVCLCAAGVGGAVGCIDRNYVSLDEFVQKQQAWEAAEQARRKDSKPNVPVGQLISPYRLGPNDLLDVTLTGLDGPLASNLYRARINKHGQVDLPMVGLVKVSDLEVSEAESAIKSAYVPQFVRELSVNLSVVAYEPTSVVVKGAAQSVGIVPLRRNERNPLFAVAGGSGVSGSDFISAVAGVGGVTRATSGRVSISRLGNPDETATYDLTDPYELASALGAEPLQNGDIVRIEPIRPYQVFVGGLVNRPGPQTFTSGVPYTLLQVLTAAGGLRIDVLPREAWLIRRLDDGVELRAKINLDRVKSGDEENIVMAAGDVLWVPHTIETRIEEFINRNLYIRGGFSLNYNMSGLDFLNSAAEQQSLNTLEDSFDPFGFLTRGSALQSLSSAPPAN